MRFQVFLWFILFDQKGDKKIPLKIAGFIKNIWYKIKF
tara:strand:- start:575 stop:688 length:114 start_codon:yes stop_codon:yes gene_type:complete